MQKLLEHSDTYKIEIDWKKEEIKFNAFKRWIDLWA
jgi:hypothetical protein